MTNKVFLKLIEKNELNFLMQISIRSIFLPSIHCLLFPLCVLPGVSKALFVDTISDRFKKIFFIVLTEDSFPIKEGHSIQPHWEYIFRQKKQVLSARAVMQKKNEQK